MNNNQYIISKNDSYIIKAIAIFLMFIHHFFTFPHWILSGGYTKFSFYFNAPTKLCVSIFAFITGWAYVLSSKHTLRNSFERICKFLINYWIVYIPVLLLSVCIFKYRPSALDIISEAFGIDTPVMKFCWYVSFYIISMILLPFIYKFIDKSLILAVVSGVIVPILFFSVLKLLVPSKSGLQLLFNNLKHWFPCICIGAIFNRYNLFRYFSVYTLRINRWIILFAAFAICNIGRYFISALDILYCSVLVFAIVNIHFVSNSIITKILVSIGKVSINMWFLHCILFNSITTNFFQPLIYWPKNPVLIYIWGVIVFYVLANIFTIIDKKVAKTIIVKKFLNNFTAE